MVEPIRPLAVRRGVVARMLGISPNRVDYLRRIGVLHAVKFDDGESSQWHYVLADIEAVVPRRDRDPTPARPPTSHPHR
jgi:hypothetical protein